MNKDVDKVRIYLTTIIVSAINYILGDMAFKMNIITEEEICDFTKIENNESEDGNTNSFVFMLFLIVIPFINIIATTLINIILIMAKEHSNGKKTK